MMEQVPSSCCRKSSLPFLMPFVLFLFMKMPKSTGSAALSVMSTSTAFGQSVVAATSVYTHAHISWPSRFSCRAFAYHTHSHTDALHVPRLCCHTHTDAEATLLWLHCYGFMFQRGHHAATMPLCSVTHTDALPCGQNCAFQQAHPWFVLRRALISRKAATGAP